MYTGVQVLQRIIVYTHLVCNNKLDIIFAWKAPYALSVFTYHNMFLFLLKSHKAWKQPRVADKAPVNAFEA